MEPLIMIFLLGYASVGKALLLTLEPNSTKEVPVPGMTNTHFTLKTCGFVGMIFREGNASVPHFQITINYNYESVVYTLIGHRTRTDEQPATVDYSSVSFPICTDPGTFWVSWGRGFLKFGEGSVVDTLTTVEVTYTGQVENFTVKTYEDLAIWDFPQVPEPTTTSTTVATTFSATSVNTTNDRIQTSTTTPDDTTSKGLGANSSTTSVDEQATDTMSKSSSPETFRSFRSFLFAIVGCFATIKLSY